MLSNLETDDDSSTETEAPKAELSGNLDDLTNCMSNLYPKEDDNAKTESPKPSDRRDSSANGSRELRMDMTNGIYKYNEVVMDSTTGGSTSISSSEENFQTAVREKKHLGAIRLVKLSCITVD